MWCRDSQFVNLGYNQKVIFFDANLHYCNFDAALLTMLTLLALGK